jgi:cytidylate kinase
MSIELEHCVSFISSQAHPGGRSRMNGEKVVARAVTISRQAGCGALVVAEKLAKYLQAFSAKDSVPWTVFDRNLMDKVLEEHDLPAYLAKFMPEDRVSELEDFLTDVLGAYPPQSKMVRQTAETILRLAHLGHVILIGRGSNVITAPMPRVLHVRLVAPLEKRIEHAHEAYHMTRPEARAFCVREDRGRARYLKKYFKFDVTDPLLYHLTINTGLVGYDEAAKMIGETAVNLAD